MSDAAVKMICETIALGMYLWFAINAVKLAYKMLKD